MMGRMRYLAEIVEGQPEMMGLDGAVRCQSFGSNDPMEATCKRS